MSDVGVHRWSGARCRHAPRHCDDRPVGLIPMPSVTLHDHDVAGVLRRAVAVINPVLDLWATDLLGVKERTRGPATSDDPIAKALDALAWVLNAADVPGTQSWEDMDVDDRIGWWVSRVGALDTLLVASPGVLGVVADRLPVQDFLGFANQAIVLCAVAREMGVTDRDRQVALLGAVMCNRDLSAPAGDSDADSSEPTEDRNLVETLWHLAGLMRAIGDELVRRPRPRTIFRYLGMLPAVGAAADYLGEYGALVRASKRGKKWIAEHVPTSS